MQIVQNIFIIVKQMLKNKIINYFYINLRKSCLHLIFFAMQLKVLEVITHLNSYIYYIGD